MQNYFKKNRNTFLRILNSENLLLICMASDEVKAYTRAQLSLRNGQDRDEIWCAYKGMIYDLKKSRLWRNGKHYEHWAGQDLTEELKDAPHTDFVFDKFEIVGRLII